jgi:hypothetical protein
MQSDFSKTLANTELLLTQLTQEAWSEWVKDHQGQNIFFGMGIMTHQAMSVAVPFDVLGMFLVAELLRRALHSKKVLVLVADQHALTNQLVPATIVQATTERVLKTVSSILKGFELSHFEVIRTVTLNDNQDIRTIYAALPSITNDYLKHEVADTLWLNQFHQVGIKLGWAMSIDSTVEGHDERFFDAEIKKFCPQMSFIHTKPGRTANPRRQRVSPYVSIEGEDRLVLSESENTSNKVSQWRKDGDPQVIKPLIRHLSQIVRLHDQLFDPSKFMTLEEKLKMLIKKSINWPMESK